MVVLGIVIVLVDHVEMGPPQFDTQYERYAGSSLFHILGGYEDNLRNEQVYSSLTNHLLHSSTSQKDRCF